MNRAYAEVIGDPVNHSKSPLIHNFWLTKLGIDAEYRVRHVTADGLAAYFRLARCDPSWRGCNVTLPHKQAVRWHVDSVDPVANVIGAINTVKNFGDHLAGTNTDCDGFMEPLKTLDLAGRKAIIIGAGGAARAAWHSLELLGAKIIAIANRNPANALDLIVGFASTADGIRVLGLDAPIPACDILVNASSLGMTGLPPLTPDLDALPDQAIVYDIVYAPLETEMLRRARGRGLTAIDGLHMLVGQAALAFEIFFGAAPPRDRDAELRALLTQ